MATTTTKNKWLKSRKNNDLLKKFDTALMEGWATDMTLGEVLNSLTKETKDFVLSLRVNTPIITDSAVEINLRLED